MPLSDHEQRLLEQMERALYEDDPKFASSLRSGSGTSLNRTRIAIGSLGAIAGLVVVVGGVATSLPIVGVAGFAAMVAGAFWAWTGTKRAAPELGGQPTAPSSSGRRSGGSGSGGSGSGGSGSGGSGSGQSDFMGRMEERWRKRREGGGSL